MLDKTELLKRTAAYVKAHPPDTGYTMSAMKAVLEAELPAGTNILVQFAMQFTGKEESTDYTHWDKPEIKLPYSNSSRYSLDKSADCSSFWWAVYKIFFDIDIGTRTLKMYAKWHKKFIPWEERQPGDIILYDFKGRNASHAAGYIGGGLIQHTTNPRDKMHIEADTYAASSRVGVFRPASDEQYNSLIAEGELKDMYLTKGSTDTVHIARGQLLLFALGYGGGMDKNQLGVFGSQTEKSVNAFRAANGLEQNGAIDDDLMSLMAIKLSDKVDTLTKEFEDYKLGVEARKAEAEAAIKKI